MSKKIFIFSLLLNLTLFAAALNADISDHSRPLADAVMLDDVLMEKFQVNPSNGHFRLSQLRAMHLPAAVDQTRDFTVQVKNGSGNVLAAYTAYAQAPNRKKSWLLGNFQGSSDASRDFKFPDEGNYVLEFSVGGKAFDSFSFRIVKHTDNNGRTRYLNEGSWNNMGFLRFDPAERRPQLTFNLWMRDLLEGTGVRPDNTGKYLVRIVRESDGKVIGVDNKDGSSSIYPTKFWKKQSFSFMDAAKPERLNAESLLAVDGSYRVELIYEDKPYGKYPFRVRNGAFEGISEIDGDRIGSDGTVFWSTRGK